MGEIKQVNVLKTNRKAPRDTLTPKLTARPWKSTVKMKFPFGTAYLQGLCSFQKAYQEGDTQVFRPACLSHSKTVKVCVEIPSLEASFFLDRPTVTWDFCPAFLHDQSGSPLVVAGCPSAWWYLCSERCRGWGTGGQYVLRQISRVSGMASPRKIDFFCGKGEISELGENHGVFGVPQSGKRGFLM